MSDNWEGVRGARNEHRTTGGRAWCGEKMWCYPTSPCWCCMDASDDYKLCVACQGEGYVPVSSTNPSLRVEEFFDVPSVAIPPVSSSQENPE